MSMGMCPTEYEKYIAVDRFGNVIFHDVPLKLMDEVKKWMKTDWGKQTFATSSGRNNSNSFGLKDLSDDVYKELGTRYCIPLVLRDHFVIAKDIRGYVRLYVDIFGPRASIPASTLSKISSDGKKILEWMSDCRDANRIIPFDSNAINDVD